MEVREVFIDSASNLVNFPNLLSRSYFEWRVATLQGVTHLMLVGGKTIPIENARECRQAISTTLYCLIANREAHEQVEKAFAADNSLIDWRYEIQGNRLHRVYATTDALCLAEYKMREDAALAADNKVKQFIQQERYKGNLGFVTSKNGIYYFDNKKACEAALGRIFNVEHINHSSGEYVKAVVAPCNSEVATIPDVITQLEDFHAREVE